MLPWKQVGKPQSMSLAGDTKAKGNPLLPVGGPALFLKFSWKLCRWDLRSTAVTTKLAKMTPETVAATVIVCINTGLFCGGRQNVAGYLHLLN